MTTMPQQKATVGAKVPTEQKEKLEQIAYDRSSPQERVTVSEVVREAISDYLDVDPDVELSDRKPTEGNTPPSGDFRGSNNGKKSEESESLYNESETGGVSETEGSEV